MALRMWGGKYTCCIACHCVARRFTFTGKRYIIPGMIRSFKCRDTQALFAGESVARFANIRSVVERKLQMLASACTVDFLRSPPGNRLEALKGDRLGQYSIRINDQWRVCFRFADGDVLDVEIVDYH